MDCTYIFFGSWYTKYLIEGTLKRKSNNDTVFNPGVHFLDDCDGPFKMQEPSTKRQKNWLVTVLKLSFSIILLASYL